MIAEVAPHGAATGVEQAVESNGDVFEPFARKRELILVQALRMDGHPINGAEAHRAFEDFREHLLAEIGVEARPPRRTNRRFR